MWSCLLESVKGLAAEFWTSWRQEMAPGLSPEHRKLQWSWRDDNMDDFFKVLLRQKIFYFCNVSNLKGARSHDFGYLRVATALRVKDDAECFTSEDRFPTFFLRSEVRFGGPKEWPQIWTLWTFPLDPCIFTPALKTVDEFTELTANRKDTDVSQTAVKTFTETQIKNASKTWIISAYPRLYRKILHSKNKRPYSDCAVHLNVVSDTYS